MYRTDHLHQIPQLPDSIVEKFRDEDELELTADEEQIADAVITEAMTVMRSVQLAERLAMQYGKTWRREFWIDTESDDTDW